MAAGGARARRTGADRRAAYNRCMTSNIFRVAIKLLASAVLALSAAWGALALWFQVPAAAWAPAGATAGCAAIAWAAFGAAALALWWRRRPRAVLAYLAAFAALLLWWSTIAPSQQRVWADDVARQMRGQVRGDIATLRDVRNFDWRSDSDYTARWEQRRYDLAQLRSVDVAMSYWMGPAIAHTLVSFGFGDGRYLTFSIEIRKERGESYSALAGFFKRYETVLVAADERDILRVRTNVRGEDMYLHRLRISPEAARALFLAYLDEADALARAPRFYDTLMANCTTIVFELARRIAPGLPLDWRLLASGYLDRYIFERGALATAGNDAAFERHRAAAHITARARAADRAADFSAAIRR